MSKYDRYLRKLKYKKKHLKIVFFTFCYLSISFSQVNLDATIGVTKPIYKMLFLNSKQSQFNPEQDILNPTQFEKIRNAVRTEFVSAATKSFLPFAMSYVKGNLQNTLQNRPEANPQDSMQNQILVMSSVLQKELKKNLQPLIHSSTQQITFPLVHSFMLIPNLENQNDLFYSSEKVSIKSDELINIFGVLPGTEGFDNQVTAFIKKAQASHLIKIPGAQVLAGRNDVIIESVDKIRLELKFLVKLQPLDTEFKEKNDQVVFEKLSIPNNPQQLPVAVITFYISVSDQNDRPIVSLRFGSFEAFEDGNFKLSETKKENSIPRLTGHLAQPAVGKYVGVQVGFTDMELDLIKGQLVSLNTIAQAGLRIGSLNKSGGGMVKLPRQINSTINEQFKTEINKKLEQELNSAIEKGQSQIEAGVITPNMTELLLNKILN